MNKKVLLVVIIIFVLAGGIIFWQSSKQNTSNLSTTKIDSSTACGTSDCNSVNKVDANLVEVFYLPHPPIDPIRKEIKNILKKFPKYQLKEYDFLDNNNKQKIEDNNLIGHIPVAIFIDGTDTFSINGQKITFKNFPKGDAFVPTLEGSWSYDDLEKVLTDPNKYKND